MSRDSRYDDDTGREAEDPRESLAESVVFAHEGFDEEACDGASRQSTVWQPVSSGKFHYSEPRRIGEADGISPEQRALEATAALVTAALLQRQPATSPSSLRLRLAAAGLEFCAQQHGGPSQTAVLPSQTAVLPRENGKPGRFASAAAAADRSRSEPFVLPRQHRPHLVALLGGCLLGLAAGFLVWLLIPPQIAPMAPDSRSPAEQLASLVSADPGLLRLHWQHGSSPLCGKVTGEVVWSQHDQRGYLTFQGLPALDEDHRFQLWIVDGQRQGAPVDGGLFAIRPGSETTVVPIDARLPVGKPAAFVVTVEGKTGAVVSKQEHVVAIASL